jgi:asparagine synthase (glutamine-hydrolysing)
MVLTGEGSDEFLSGYPKHRIERYAVNYNRIPSLLKHQIQRAVQHLPYSYWRHKTAINCLSLKQWEQRMPAWFGALSPADRKELLSFEVEDRINYRSPPFDIEKENSSLRKILYFDQTSWLHDNLLERGDRMTMAASLEARMPFMDYQLAEYVSSLPDKYRLRGNTSKWLLREGMKQLLPDEIINRPKVGFRVPVSDWFRGEMKDYLHDHLLGRDSKTIDLYKREVLERYINEHSKGRQNHEKLLWTLLNLEVWQREYGMSL